ncbi:hypothetical protein ACNTMW_30475 [Planosporangium sp. 12N6]|uniref:hypothetical protein n=1 Tax=Planosporangium spinosum TaxID=3402278 RepID=UPI003CE74D4A
MRVRKLGALAGTAVVASTVLVAGPTPAHAASCGVSGGKLWCNNKAPVYIRDKPSLANPSSERVDTLRTTYSWFSCWSTGELHGGGNYTWYKTQGDDYGAWGWLAAEYMYTSWDFDANPSAYGLPRCQYPW